VTDGLPEWLRDQLDKDATEIADDYSETGWHARGCESLPDVLHPGRDTGACDCGVPARVLREIEAKRALVDEYTQAEESLDRWTCPDMSDVGRAEGLGAAIALLAVPYADRSGYREEWRP
jgi:hypothetical protein